MLIISNHLKDGLAGLMRVHNEAALIEGCIDSCIDALDELIVVCNDCTDETPAILERKRKQYPSKLKVYSYNHKVLSFDLSEEEYKEALNLPDDSVRLYCNMCNFGLQQSHYKYVVKIDTDQLYFAAELKKWRDACCRGKWKMVCCLGWLFMIYVSVYRRASVAFGRPLLFLLSNWLIEVFRSPYLKFSAWQLRRGKVAVSLSGINVFHDDKWYIPFDTIHKHFPYNGTGDTVIFKLTPETYFTRWPSIEYQSVTENFHNPYKVVYAGLFWFHLHANRVHIFDKVKRVKDEYPEMFVSFEDFAKMPYAYVHRKMRSVPSTLFMRILYALIHPDGKNMIAKYSYLLCHVKLPK